MSKHSNEQDDLIAQHCTWEGSEREQIRRWLKMTVRERLQAVEQMCALAEKLNATRGKSHPSHPTTR